MVFHFWEKEIGEEDYKGKYIISFISPSTFLLSKVKEFNFPF